MKEYFNGFSTQELVEMKRDTDERKEKKELQKRLDDIKNYLKQVHYERNHGIISSDYLIYNNIVRLCDGFNIIEGEEDRDEL